MLQVNSKTPGAKKVQSNTSKAKGGLSASVSKPKSVPSTKATPKTVTTKAASAVSGAKPAVENMAATKSPKKVKKVLVSPEQREVMVAEAAYYLAEKRGFIHGYDLQDWLDAKAQIELVL